MTPSNLPPGDANGRGQPIEKDADEGRDLRRLRARAEKFDGERWQAAQMQKAQMPPLPEVDFGLDDKALKRLEGAPGVFVPYGGRRAKVQVRKARNPDDHGSFGFAGAFAKVEAKDSFVLGTLALPLEAKNLEGLARETIRLFRWNGEEAGFVPVEPSGVADGASHVWACITQPGVYAAIGLPTDPLILHTIKLFCSLGPHLATMEPERRRALQHSICELILCAPELRTSLDQSGAIEGLLRGALDRVGPDLSLDFPVLPPAPGGGRGPGSICDQCLGATIHPRLPECHLLGPTGREPHGPRLPPPHRCIEQPWSDVGPADLSGCVLQVIIDPANADRLYAVAADGGLWRLPSVAAYPGTTWVPLTDQQPSLGMAAAAIAPSDPQVIYYADVLQYLYRSSDTGATWVRTSGAMLGGVRKILVHPRDPDTVFVASTTGLWMSGDSGATWRNARSADVTDAAMDPTDSSILYIGERNTGVLKTYNLGLSWQTVLPWSAASAPGWTMIKIALGRLGTDANRTVAAKLNEEVFVNRRGGRGGVGANGWLSRGRLAYMGQWDWDHVIAVDPSDDDSILVGGQVLYRTTNGGANWTQVASFYDPHEDQQSVVHDPSQRDVVYLSNDGGIWRSTDGGTTWHSGNRRNDIAARRDLNSGLVTAQFYRAGVVGDRAVGDLYHSGIIASNSLSGRGWEGIEGHAWEWQHVYGDGRRATSFYVFAGSLGRRRFPGTGANDFIIPWGSPSFVPTAGPAVGALAADPRYASQTLIVGTSGPGRVMRTLNGDVDAPQWSAVPGISLANETIVSVAFAPSRPGKAYAASDTGRVFVQEDVNDDAITPIWTQAGQWASPTGSPVRQLAVNSVHHDRIYLLTAREVVRSAAGGSGWTPIVGSGATALPADDFHSIVARPGNGATLFVASDIGVFISRDDGATWHPYDQDLPNALIDQIMWSDGYLYAVTYGRGLWRLRPCP